MDIDIHVANEEESHMYRTFSLALYNEFSEQPEGFEFQMDLRHPSDPRASRPPMFCVVNGQHDASYGEILDVVWDAPRCEIRFTDTAASTLRLPESRVVLHLNLQPAELRQTAAALKRILSYGPPDALPSLVGFPEN